MKSVQCITFADNSIQDSLTPQKLKEAKSYYELISPKSTLQLKLQQAMHKSKGSSSLEEEFQILRRTQERSVKALAEKEGQLEYFRNKISQLSQKESIYQKIMRNLYESLQKMCSTLNIERFVHSEELSIDCDESSFIEEYQFYVVNCLEEIQERFTAVFEERNDGLASSSQGDSDRISNEMISKIQQFESENKMLRNLIAKLEEENALLSEENKEKSEELYKYKTQESEFQQLMGGIDLKLKNRKQLIYILKGLSKRYRRLQRELKVKGDKLLKPGDLEQFVRQKEKQFKQKRSSCEKILDFS